jgi:hypothetical protein
VPHDIYQNDHRIIGFEIYIRDRNKIETKATIASGTFYLVDHNGQTVVPLSAATIKSPNIITFFITPNAGTANIGIYSEVWNAFIGSESFTHIDTLTIKEKF